MTQNSGRPGEPAGAAFNSEAHESACSHMSLMRAPDDAHDLKAFGELTHVPRSHFRIFEFVAMVDWFQVKPSWWQTVSRIPPSAIG